MASDAQDHQVGGIVVAAAQYAEPVMDVELSLRRGNAADLAARAPAFDQGTPAGRSEACGARTPIVGLAHALAKRRPGQQRRELAGTPCRAGRANHVEVGRCRATFRVPGEEVEHPGPFQAARFARPTAAAHHRAPGPGCHTQSVRTHVRRSLARWGRQLCWASCFWRDAGAVNGRVKWNSVPWPGRLSNQIRPPCMSTIWRAMGRPRPVPCAPLPFEPPPVRS